MSRDPSASGDEQGRLMEHYRHSLELLAGGIAHEFNNLLTSIGGYSQLALDKAEDPEISRKALETCMRAAQRGAEIVERLGHFAQVESPAWETSDMVPVVRDVVELVRLRCEHEEIRVDLQIAEAPTVRFDRGQLGTALLEILRNAWDACRRQERSPRIITVSVRQEDGDAVVRIRDTGPGLAPDEIRQASLPFFTRNGPFGGGNDASARGLGLAAASGLIRNQGGQLSIESIPDNGTEIRIALPPARPVRLGKGRVLVVDDEEAIRRIFRRFLERAGYDVDTVESGEAAFAAVQNIRYNLVLLDQMMPHKSGLEFLAELQTLPAEQRPPVVMVTAVHEPELARKAVAAGAVVCTTKPVNFEKIAYLAAVHTRTGTPPRTPPDPRLAHQDVPRHVLVVESDPLVRDILHYALSQKGYRVTAVETGTRAQRATQREYYDLILVDILLHDRGGPGVVKTLRLNNPYTPIVVCSDNLSRRSMEDVLASGATRCVKKGVDIYPLLDEVSHLLQIFSSEPS